MCVFSVVLIWVIPKLYVANGCFTKHPFKAGCLGLQAWELVGCHWEIDLWELKGPTFQEIAGLIKGFQGQWWVSYPLFKWGLMAWGGHFTFPKKQRNNNYKTWFSFIKSTWNLKHLFMIIQILLWLVQLGDSKSYLNCCFTKQSFTHLHIYIYTHTWKDHVSKWSQ